MPSVFLVGIGGFFGAIARHLVASFVSARIDSDTWPLGTFVVNVTGCFALGFFATWAAGRTLPEHWRFVVPIGFIGAYTTFSTFELETLRLIEAGAWPRALGYVLTSTVLGFLALAAATALLRR